jgi:hypothetical protein
MVSRGKGRSAPQVYSGSFYDLCGRFIESEVFRGYTMGTQDLWSRELRFACAPNCLGDISLTDIRPALVQGYLDGWSDKPGNHMAKRRCPCCPSPSSQSIGRSDLRRAKTFSLSWILSEFIALTLATQLGSFDPFDGHCRANT